MLESRGRLYHVPTEASVPVRSGDHDLFSSSQDRLGVKISKRGTACLRIAHVWEEAEAEADASLL